MLKIEPVPVLSDNISWILADSSGRAVVVDAGEAEPIRRALVRLGLELDALLLTHHHADHTAAAAELAGDRPVFGPRGIPAVTRPVSEGDTIPVGEAALAVWHTPGHTLDHLCYLAPGLVLTGDTLFGGGCGRLFEGTAAQMHRSLRRLAELPLDTVVLCGHEYTASNLRFASLVEPDNPDIVTRLELSRRATARGRLSVPSTIAEELATNPFLRSDLSPVRSAVASAAGRTPADQVETFALLRAWKDRAS